MNPRVSIVIPTYNHAAFLREALESVRAQTIADWEAIVMNNYSTDDTVAVIEAFADPRIRLENFRNNGVIGASRNRGIALARAPYVAFLDSDDRWMPEKLARCLPLLDAGADLVSHGLRFFGEREGDMFCGPAERASFDALLDQGSCITPSATVVRRSSIEAVGCFSEEPAVVTSEDYHLWIKMARSGARMEFIREVLGEYRIHSANQSGSVLRHLNSVLRVVDEFLPESAVGVGARLRRRRCFGLAYYGAARGMQKNRQFGEAARLYGKALACRPLFARIYVVAALNMVSMFRAFCSNFGSRS